MLDVRFQPIDRPKKAHPDNGGDAELMSNLNRARDFIEKAVRA